jgi:hypothetical protein
LINSNNYYGQLGSVVTTITVSEPTLLNGQFNGMSVVDIGCGYMHSIFLLENGAATTTEPITSTAAPTSTTNEPITSTVAPISTTNTPITSTVAPSSTNPPTSTQADSTTSLPTQVTTTTSPTVQLHTCESCACGYATNKLRRSGGICQQCLPCSSTNSPSSPAGQAQSGEDNAKESNYAFKIAAGVFSVLILAVTTLFV